MSIFSRQWYFPQWHTLIFIVALALAAVQGFLFLSALGQTPAAYNLGIDGPTYLELARQVQRLGISAIPIYQPPGFILFLAGFFSVVGEDLLLLKLLNLLLVGVTSTLVYVWIRSVLGPRQALFSAIPLLFSPLMISYCATLQYEVLVAFLCTLTIVLTVAAARRVSPLPAALAGLVLATTALVREPLVVLLPILSMLFLGAKRTDVDTRRRTASVTLFISCALIPILLWILHQHQTWAVWVPISSKGAINLSLGFNPNANGTYHATMQPPIAPMGIDYLIAQPWGALTLVARKFGYLWGFLDDGWNVPRRAALVIQHVSAGMFDYTWAIRLSRTWVSILAFIGIICLYRAPRFRKELWFLPPILLCLVATHSIFLSSARFIIPTLPGVFILASIPLQACFEYGKKYRVMIFLVAGTFAILLCLPVPFILSIEAEKTDGFSVTNAACPECSGSMFRLVPAIPDSRIAMLLNDTFLPAGRYAVTIRSHGALAPVPGTITGFGDRRQRLFKVALQSDKTASYQAVFELRKSQSVALAVVAPPNQALGMDVVTVERLNLG